LGIKISFVFAPQIKPVNPETGLTGFFSSDARRSIRPMGESWLHEHLPGQYFLPTGWGNIFSFICHFQSLR
jgi:hypothetical protein